MRVTEIWEKAEKPTISFELFPARSPKAEKRLPKAIDKLVTVEPTFVSVTFGAGGSTREGSLELVRNLIKDRGLEVMAYFACYGLGPEDMVGALTDYKEIGISNVLAVRGDPPHDNPDFKSHPESLAYASDLVEFIKSRFDFCLGCAGYPEGHIDAESRNRDLEFLKLKVDRGAEYVIANYFYDNQLFFDFVDRARALGVEVPILPGVMPIYNVKMMQNLASLCGATITEEIRSGIAGLPEGDKAALNDWGVDFADKQCRGLIEKGVPGLHIYTMDRAKSAVALVEKLRADGLV